MDTSKILSQCKQINTMSKKKKLHHTFSLSSAIFRISESHSLFTFLFNFIREKSDVYYTSRRVYHNASWRLYGGILYKKTRIKFSCWIYWCDTMRIARVYSLNIIQSASNSFTVSVSTFGWKVLAWLFIGIIENKLTCWTVQVYNILREIRLVFSFFKYYFLVWLNLGLNVNDDNNKWVMNE